MDLMWQVCELEDNCKSFLRFTVSAVPENWIVELEDGSLICYWPKVNPLRKIRSLQNPEVDGKNWTYYKCRILMNGDKFSTYEEAKEAEKIAENFSSMSEFKNDGACDSTMHFDVSDVSDVDTDEIDSDEFDTDGMNDEIVGNDSFDFNRAILKGGAYCSKKAAQPDDIFSMTKRIDSNISEMSDYSSEFKSNKNGFLTSTLLDGINLEKSDDTKIVSMISSIEKNILLFVGNIQKDLRELKELIRSTVTKPEKDEQDEVLILQSEQNMNALAVRKDNSPETNIEQEKEIEKAFSIVLEENLSNDAPNVQFTKIKVLNVEILNETFPITQEVPLNAETLNAVDLIDEEVLNDPIPTANEIPNDETFVANSPEEVKLPISSKHIYERNEDLLDETAMEDALIEHLLPLDDEDEVAYMNRTVFTVFDGDFLIDCVTMRPEKDEKRVLIKNSNILHCWQESFGRKFPRDVDNKKFLLHFRRVKSAKRASRKTAKEGKIGKRSGKQ